MRAAFYRARKLCVGPLPIYAASDSLGSLGFSGGFTLFRPVPRQLQLDSQCAAVRERQRCAFLKATQRERRIMIALAWQLSAHSRVPFSIERIKP